MPFFGLNCLDSQTSSSNVCNPNCKHPDRYLVNGREIDFSDGGSKCREGNLGKDKWKSEDRMNEEEEGKAEEWDFM